FYYSDNKLVLNLHVFCLRQQTFPEIPGGNAGWIKVLDPAEDFFNLGGICPAHFNDLFNRRIEVTIIVEISDYTRTDFPLLIREVGKSELPDQVVFQRCGFG